jgi:UDP-2,3-diacylglucosamine pyrophosphatase LpxH
LKTNKTASDERRPVEVVVISDVHLGTYGCHAKELTHYLKSIKPEMLILNGDIIDMWQFSKKYFPKSHMKVVKEIIRFAAKGIPVYYITGNHDEMLRKFAGFKLGNLEITNKLLLDLDDKKAWIFHGDVFDVTMQHAKWLTKLGAIGYDTLIIINSSCNYILEKLGREKISLSKKIKNSVKSAVKYINNFEAICADIAINNGYEYVLCGHIHQPEIRTIKNEVGSVQYLNSGDWVENLTALEYNNKEWTLYSHPISKKMDDDFHEDENEGLDNKQLFKMLIDEIHTNETNASVSANAAGKE